MNNRARPGQAYCPTDVEHIANVITHGLWILPSVAGIMWMVYLARSELEFLSAVIYGLSLVLLFSVSTTFHAISYSGKCGSLKNFFHIGDRAVIYIFIASSYTPWLTLKDMGSWGCQFLCLVWLLAAIGIAYQYTFHEQYKWLETLFYLVIAISPSVAIVTMKESSGLVEMTAGGMVYMAGVIFFKCDGLIPFAHAIWHCFVIVGALFQYYAVCTYLLGQANTESTKLSSLADSRVLEEL
ncbi:monocyte to macrophage differentiation factor 2-like isoform X2 [Liolophura sinensis]